MAKILHQVEVAKSAADVYASLTNASGLQGWWSQFSQFEGETVGSGVRVGFYNNMVVFELEIKELVPSKKVVWSVKGGPPDWDGTLIGWDLVEDSGKTIVNFSHTGFASTGGDFARVNYNWGWYLTSLRFYLEKGVGTPHTEADLPPQ